MSPPFPICKSFQEHSMWPLHLCISLLCVCNRSSVNVVHTVNVDSKSFIITLLWEMMNRLFRNLCQIIIVFWL